MFAMAQCLIAAKRIQFKQHTEEVLAIFFFKKTKSLLVFRKSFELKSYSFWKYKNVEYMQFTYI